MNGKPTVQERRDVHEALLAFEPAVALVIALARDVLGLSWLETINRYRKEAPDEHLRPLNALDERSALAALVHTPELSARIGAGWTARARRLNTIFNASIHPQGRGWRAGDAQRAAQLSAEIRAFLEPGASDPRQPRVATRASRPPLASPPITRSAAAKDPVTSVELRKQCRRLHLERGADEVLAIADRFLAQTPNDGDALAAKFSLLTVTGRVEEAVATATLWTSLAPHDSHAWYMRTRFLEGLELHGEALATAEQWTSLMPDDASALYWRSRLLARLSNGGKVANLAPIAWPELHAVTWLRNRQALDLARRYQAVLGRPVSPAEEDILQHAIQGTYAHCRTHDLKPNGEVLGFFLRSWVEYEHEEPTGPGPCGHPVNVLEGLQKDFDDALGLTRPSQHGAPSEM